MGASTATASSRGPATSGRKPRFDLDAASDAAIDILDEAGPRALTMASVAKRVGVTPMALYRVVRNKADLESAIVRKVFQPLALSSSSEKPWEEGITDWMHSLRDCWRSHAWVGALIASGSGTPPGLVPGLDALACHLEAAGLAPEDVARELVMISDLTFGSLLVHSVAPLPHSSRLTKTIGPHDNTEERRRWRPIAAASAKYDGDQFFAELVSWTLARVRDRIPRRRRRTATQRERKT